MDRPERPALLDRVSGEIRRAEVAGARATVTCEQSRTIVAASRRLRADTREAIAEHAAAPWRSRYDGA